MSSGYVLWCRFPGFRPTCVALPEGLTVIGRSSECNFVIPNAMVSRQHAEIEIVGQSAVLRDLGSSNGTYLGGRKIDEARLECGQEVRLGRGGFLLQLVKAEEVDFDSDELTKNFDEEKDPNGGDSLVNRYALTPAQRRVLSMLLDGLSEKRVAAALRLAQQTVHSHVKEIYRTCDVHSRAELLALFVKRTIAD